jgi:hypothetical protein
MKTTMLKVLWISGLILLTGTMNAQEKYNLEYRYKTGDTFRYQNSSDYDMVQEMNGQEIKMTGSSNSILKLIIESVSAEGNITFVNSYEEMKSSVKSGIMDTTFEQKDIIGKRGKVIIDKFGKEISSEMIDTVKKAGGMDGSGVTSLKSVDLPKLPGYPVAVGEKWTDIRTDTTKVGEGTMIITYNSEYTLLQKEMKDGHECFTIAVVSRSETTGKMMQMGMEMFIEGTAESNGTAWFDPVLGILVAKESVMNQDLTYAMTGQMNMSIPSTQVIKTSFKLIK